MIMNYTAVAIIAVACILSLVINLFRKYAAISLESKNLFDILSLLKNRNFLIFFSLILVVGLVNSLLMVYAQQIEPSVTKVISYFLVISVPFFLINIFINIKLFKDIWNLNVVMGSLLISVGLVLSVVGLRMIVE
jgi:hypothetical protein